MKISEIRVFNVETLFIDGPLVGFAPNGRGFETRLLWLISGRDSLPGEAVVAGAEFIRFYRLGGSRVGPLGKIDCQIEEFDAASAGYLQTGEVRFGSGNNAHYYGAGPAAHAIEHELPDAHPNGPAPPGRLGR